MILHQPFANKPRAPEVKSRLCLPVRQAISGHALDDMELERRAVMVLGCGLQPLQTMVPVSRHPPPNQRSIDIEFSGDAVEAGPAFEVKLHHL